MDLIEPIVTEKPNTDRIPLQLERTHNTCPLCTSDKIEKLPKFNGAFLASCMECSFVFSERIPTKKELDAYYNDEYEVTSFYSQITAARYNELLDYFEKFRLTNKILDVGCGNGFFLEAAQKRGWEVYGADFSKSSIEICKKKGIHMHEGILTSDAFPPDSFDVVTSFEVLEHINNPNEELGYINSFLRKNGIAYVTTPNFNALLRYRLGEKYDVINYPEHLTYYTRKTLKKVFQKNNFRALSIRTTGVSITRLKTSKGKSNQAYVSETSDDELLRHKIEKKWHLKALKRFTNWWLNLFKIGNSLKGIFQKV
ncbi:MAG: 2-polyprenyl-3-methyl-5-hydroxy-6-metoxy-1,4-benzoquinol methylase [Crocinitomicaceae bacterium]|jgi:2-polyprenyl-3-methyl-5-hydroxy-6-metoxy-1,4-benzoquinol methylase